MTRIAINTQRCTRCGRCIRICPLGLFKGDPETPTYRIPNAENLCIACGHCTCVCPTGAITLDDVRPDTLESANQPVPNFEDIRHLVQRRRSIRLYQSRMVPRAEIERILEATRWAPTARNSQQVSWTVLTQPERVRELAEMVVDFFRQKQQAQGLITAWENGYDMVLRGAPHLVATHGPEDSPWSGTDGTIALTTFELLARAANLGTCWAGFLMWAAREQPDIGKALGLPENHQLQGALMLGYPLSAFLRIPSRKIPQVNWVG